MTTNATIAWARGYYAKGWTCLPLPAGKKTPPPKGYTGAGTPDMTLQEVELTLADGGNLGLRMPEGVIGIDCDDYDDKGGAATLMMMEVGIAGFGESLGVLPDSPRLTSRNDAYSGIRFYRVPAGVDLRDPGPGVETIRRSWRYAVAAPSMHPDTGNRYRWVAPDGTEVEPPAVTDLPELPAAWVEHLRIDPRPSYGAVRAPSSMSEVEMLELFRGFAQGNQCASVARSGETAMKAATRKLGGAHNALLVPVFELLRQGMAGCPGAGVALVKAFQAYASLDPDVHVTDFLNMVAPKVEAARDDPWSCGECIGRSLEPAAIESEDAKAETDNPYRIIDWTDFWKREKKPVNWLVEGVIQRGQQMVLFSLPGVGKSLLAGEFAVLLATGRPVLGGPALEPMRVLYVDLENSEDDVHDRLSSWGFAGSALDGLHYSLLGDWPPLNTEAGGLALAKYVAEHRIEVVVIDTTSRVVEGDVNSPNAIADLWNKCQVRLKRIGVTVIRIDHAGKNADRGQLGSVMKSADQDVIWEMTAAAGDAVSMTCRKDRANVIGTGSKLGLRRQKNPLRHLPVTSTAATPEGGGEAAGSAAESLDADQFEAELQVLELLDRLYPGKKVGKVVARKALNDHGLKGPDNTRLQSICTERNRVL